MSAVICTCLHVREIMQHSLQHEVKRGLPVIGLRALNKPAMKYFSTLKSVTSTDKAKTCYPVVFKRISQVNNETTLSVNADVRRFFHQNSNEETTDTYTRGKRSTLYYMAAVGVLAVGLSYAAVPLYRIFCQAYSYGGTTVVGHDAEKVESMKSVKDRELRIRFNADTAASMTWNFRPQQSEIKVVPGETALAFYTAKNPTDRPVIGVSTYNVVPFDAGLYFNKIQCFCFEEQMLNPREEVHMPVFFYIDPEFADDPKMEGVNTITLSYTFFEAREGIQLPVPTFAKQ